MFETIDKRALKILKIIDGRIVVSWFNVLHYPLSFEDQPMSDSVLTGLAVGSLRARNFVESAKDDELTIRITKPGQIYLNNWQAVCGTSRVAP